MYRSARRSGYPQPTSTSMRPVFSRSSYGLLDPFLGFLASFRLLSLMHSGSDAFTLKDVLVDRTHLR